MAKKGRPPKKFGLSPEDIELMSAPTTTTLAPKINPLDKLQKFKPLNKSESLLQKTIAEKDIVIGIGSAGSGKTYSALSIALNMVKDKTDNYEAVALAKSVIPVKDEDVGFLPGDLTEKMAPTMYSFTGNVNKILKMKDANTALMAAGLIEWSSIAFLRGCQYDQRIVIVDEAQNLSMNTFKTIITRLGKSSKIIFLGDMEQIDRKNKNDSCLAIIAELFKESPDIGIVHFEEGEHFRKPAITAILKTLRENNY